MEEPMDENRGTLGRFASAQGALEALRETRSRSTDIVAANYRRDRRQRGIQLTDAEAVKEAGRRIQSCGAHLFSRFLHETGSFLELVAVPGHTPMTRVDVTGALLKHSLAGRTRLCVRGDRCSTGQRYYCEEHNERARDGHSLGKKMDALLRLTGLP